jgi:hypothetical protein
MSTHPHPTPPAGWEPQPEQPKDRRARRVVIGLAAGLVFVLASAVVIGQTSNAKPKPTAQTTEQAAPDTTLPPNSEDPGELGVPEDENAFPDSTESEEPPAPEKLAVGSTWTWADGLQAKIIGIKRAPISEVGSFENTGRYENLAIVVKLTATDGASDDVAVTAELFYGSDGRSAESVFDSAEYGGIETDGMSDTPDKLREGKSVTGTFGFAVPKNQDPTEVSFVLNPGFAYEDGTFDGRA